MKLKIVIAFMLLMVYVQKLSSVLQHGWVNGRMEVKHGLRDCFTQPYDSLCAW